MMWRVRMWHRSVLSIANRVEFSFCYQEDCSLGSRSPLWFAFGPEFRVQDKSGWQPPALQVRKMPAWCNAGFYFTSEWNLMFFESLLQRNSLWLPYEWWVLKNNVCATYLCGNFRKCMRRGKQPAARIMVKAKLKVELTQYKQLFFPPQIKSNCECRACPFRKGG